jgi:hypothetical protein
MKYRFHNAEIGVMYEIMLPKKIQYQDFLFNALVNGLQTFTFSSYFEKNKESVKQLFEEYSDYLIGKRAEVQLFDTDYTAIFQGYSMFEVNGVFRHEKSNSFDEELTQIVRVYFLPDYEDMMKRFPDFSRIEILQFADSFFSLHTNMYRRLQEFYAVSVTEGSADEAIHKRQKVLYDYLNHWVDAVSLFVFGYVIHEICKHLDSYYEEKRLTTLEKEIWVSSHWGILINRTRLKG